MMWASKQMGEDKLVVKLAEGVLVPCLSSKYPSIHVDIILQGIPLWMLVDTEATRSCLNGWLYAKYANAGAC